MRIPMDNFHKAARGRYRMTACEDDLVKASLDFDAKTLSQYKIDPRTYHAEHVLIATMAPIILPVKDDEALRRVPKQDELLYSLYNTLVEKRCLRRDTIHDKPLPDIVISSKREWRVHLESPVETAIPCYSFDFAITPRQYVALRALPLQSAMKVDFRLGKE